MYGDKFSRTSEAIITRNYGEDYLDSLDTVKDVKLVLDQGVQTHQEGGLKLRGLVSNTGDVVSNQ